MSCTAKDLDSLLWGKNVLHSKQNKGKTFQISIFMMRLPLSFQIHHVLTVISGKGLCTNETAVFTQPEPVSEVREGMERTQKENFSILFLCWKLDSSLVCSS